MQDKAVPLYKLAMQSQRQAAQALATAAVLNKLVDADAVTVVVGDCPDDRERENCRLRSSTGSDKRRFHGFEKFGEAVRM